MISTLKVLVIALIATASASATVGGPQVTRETHRGWADTYRVANGALEARVVTAIGPRIIDLRTPGGENLLYVREGEAGRSGEAEWVLRGGWRLWIAPERRDTTYVPDNQPCHVELIDGRMLRVTGPVQPVASIQKIVELEACAGRPCLHVRSRLRNIGGAPVTYAAWSLSVLRPGGRAFAPLDVGPLEAFDATRMLRLWSYAELADPRYRFGERLVEVAHARVAPAISGQRGRRDDESKIGVDSAQGWAAYLLGRTLYLKRFPHQRGGTYPDGGATIEIYSSAEFLELENLSPLTTIPPGGELSYPEDWWVFTDVGIPAGEVDALRTLQTYVDRAPTTFTEE